MIREECSTCRFASRLSNHLALLDCQRHAPITRPPSEYWHAAKPIYPNVAGDHWCGDYEPHPTEKP